MASEFEGPRTAIVTGGARRIGAAMARALSEDGWHLLIHCHKSEAEAQALAAELGNAKVVRADLAQTDCAEWVMAARERVSPELWDSLSINQRLRFRIAFCLGGTAAIDVERM